MPDAFYRFPSPLSAAPPGSIIRSSLIDTAGQLPAGSHRLPGDLPLRVDHRHRHRRVRGDRRARWDPAGRRVPHRELGPRDHRLAAQCAPSRSGVGSIPYLDPLLDARMIVVATDYEGLGTPGIQPYLVGQSEAQGVLDAARAARSLVGRAASNTVVVIGYSQGGQAALFAGQIAQSYAPELYRRRGGGGGPGHLAHRARPPVPGARTDADAGFAVMALYAWSATYGDLPLTSVLTTERLARRGR